MIKNNRIGPLHGNKGSAVTRSEQPKKPTEDRPTPKTTERPQSKSRLGSATRKRSGSASRRLVFGQNTPQKQSKVSLDEPTSKKPPLLQKQKLTANDQMSKQEMLQIIES